MIELRPYKAEDAIAILEAKASEPNLVLTDITREWAKLKEQRGPAITGFVEGKPIGCGGLEILWPGMAEGWCLFASNISTYHHGPAKIVKRTLMQWVKDYHLVRVQAPLRADFPIAIQFALWLGLKYEGTLRKYHPDGTDAMMFAWIGE